MGHSKPPKKGATASESAQSAFEDTRERILNTLYEEYNDTKDGLIRMSSDCEFAYRKLKQPKKVSVHRPKKKINVVLTGNHSAGKSSFINWYVGEELMKAGVAIETKNITFVTYGKRRETFKGPASLRLHPHLEELSKIPGVQEHLVTEVSASRARKFGSVCLIDTPGLVDGAFVYPFEVNDALVWLGENAADLVLVLLDPQGQALCARTMDVVQKLDAICSEKMHFFLSKADTAVDEHDRQRVLIQITQGLSQRIQNKNFDIVPIYVPIPGVNDTSDVPNRIDEVCKLTDKAINATLQSNIHRMEKDAELLVEEISAVVSSNAENVSYNRRTVATAAAFGSIALVPIALLFALGVSLGRPMFEWLPENVLEQVDRLKIPQDWVNSFALINIAIILVVWLYAKFAFRTRPTLSSSDVAKFRKHKARLGSRIKRVTKDLYDEYFKVSIDEDYADQ